MSATTEIHEHNPTHDHRPHVDHEANAPKLYLLILIILLVLTCLTVAASYVQFGSGMANVAIALTIATIKASLVALFFMHLIHDRPMNSVILVMAFAFLGLFLAFDYTDVASREALLPANLKVTKRGAPTSPPGAAPGTLIPAPGTPGANGTTPSMAPAIPAPAEEHH
jgi:cytochrome c oxidase subunit 4